MRDRLTKLISLLVILLLVFVLYFSPRKVFAQQAEEKVSGVVLDINTQNPLPGVSVILKGERRGTLTNAEGAFSIEAKNGDTLLFSFIGYEKKEIEIEGGSAGKVYLRQSTSQLDQLVVIGYGSEKKANVTGSVVQVSGDIIKSSPVNNISNAITGLLPGVVTKNTSGEPGRDDATVLIRGQNTTGNNSPLVVVDGIQGVEGWQRINPNDIKSISVLKDASASIYGARAANGVILITTKRGTIGKPVISYSFNQGISQPTKVPVPGNSATLAEYFNQKLKEEGQAPRFTEEEIQKYRDGSDPVNYPNINWFDGVLKKASLQSQHNLSVRGGNESVKYYVSGSYSHQNSIFKHGSLDFKTYSIRSNIDAQISKHIKVGLDVNGGLDDGNYPAFSTTAMWQFLNINLPWMPVYYSNGLPSAGVERGENPIVMASSASGNNNNIDQRFDAKVSFDIDIPWVEGLGIDGYFDYRNYVTTGKNWQTPWTVYNYDKANDSYIPMTGGGIDKPQLTQSLTKNKYALVNLRIKYKRTFNDNHNLDVFVAGEASTGRYSFFSAFRRDFISSEIDELFAGSPSNQQTDGTASETGRENLFGRLHYDFKQKYLMDFNFRYDGSSNFPKGKRFGFFPGVSVGWRISEENFLKNTFDFVENLKLRASIGQMGNDRISPFQFLRLYNLGNKGYNFGQPPGLSLGLVPGVSPNPNITWEVATASDIGLDGELWNGLLGFTIDFFKQKRSNILAARNLSVPAFTGLILPEENIGRTQNEGLEIELSTMKSMNDFSYKVSGNIAFHKSKIIYLDEPSNIPEWQKVEGHVIGSDLYYKSLGIIRTEDQLEKIPVIPGTEVGDLQYEDINGDGVIDGSDQVRLDKSNIPKLTYGLNFTLNYKAFSLFANFAGAAKVWELFRFQALLGYNALQEVLENRYVPGSMDSKYPILPTQKGVSGLPSTFWLRNVSYVRLKTLEVGYNLPAEFLSKIRMTSARVYVNGSNLFTWSGFRLFDPEGSNNQGFFYPQMRMYNIGINLTF